MEGRMTTRNCGAAGVLVAEKAVLASKLDSRASPASRLGTRAVPFALPYHLQQRARAQQQSA